jgi:hypothetical protein
MAMMTTCFLFAAAFSFFSLAFVQIYDTAPVQEMPNQIQQPRGIHHFWGIERHATGIVGVWLVSSELALYYTHRMTVFLNCVLARPNIIIS